nr:hypothetical protein [Microbacterium azadirachtae]
MDLLVGQVDVLLRDLAGQLDLSGRVLGDPSIAHGDVEDSSQHAVSADHDGR